MLLIHYKRELIITHTLHSIFFPYLYMVVTQRITDELSHCLADREHMFDRRLCASRRTSKPSSNIAYTVVDRPNRPTLASGSQLRFIATKTITKLRYDFLHIILRPTCYIYVYIYRYDCHDARLSIYPIIDIHEYRYTINQPLYTR